jgi:hypothetical protein
LLTIPTVRNHRKHPYQFTRPPNTRQRFPRFLARTGNNGRRLRPPERDLELEPGPYTGRVVFAPYVLLQVCPRSQSLHTRGPLPRPNPFPT